MTECCRREEAVVYADYIFGVLLHLRNRELAAMRDPLGLSVAISPCTAAQRTIALRRLDIAIARAERALDADLDHNPRAAFRYWASLFGGMFPSYGR